MAAIAVRITKRAGITSSAGTALVSHAYPPHAHYNTASSAAPPDHPDPSEVSGEEAGHLGEGEDEDQVEEQLEGVTRCSVGSPPSVAICAEPAVLIRCPPLVFLPPLPFNIF